ncbi:hypothetical protein [Nocardia goodfellowii]|uniref:Uncharacterized protein n=1 Tax=Nocardia goodfellowii TaxID=882446 RepID=A0ABS4QCR0_9NOCA|nr:hypothetical protein [Nocardia goodfellowii]MBP2188486.1 hypothetical protein [Nocardia goodfellowii]
MVCEHTRRSSSSKRVSDSLIAHLLEVYSEIDQLKAIQQSEAATFRDAIEQAVGAVQSNSKRQAFKDLGWALGGITITFVGIAVSLLGAITG